MYFFEKNEKYSNRIACIDDNRREYTYAEIWEIGDRITAESRPRELVLLQCSNKPESLAAYLAYLRKKCPVILMGETVDESLIQAMRDTYFPDKTVENDDKSEIYEELALLLSTSGSTGAQKLVRLSYDNLQSNCESIIEYLGITAEERAITTLPMEYTYGLSVIHTHLAAGATIVLTEKTLFDKDFWEMVSDLKITSMAGVPYTYEMFNRLKLTAMDLPSLKTMTQAGGHLKPELQEKFGEWAKATGREFFIMYGQTEATARMSYVPSEKCLVKPGSIGIPVPGGKIELADDGEMIYSGPNVSLGYAVCRADLSRGDDNKGMLATGDIAYRDDDGYLYITGRKKRFIKLQGKRISLDQIQDTLQDYFETSEIVCTGRDDRGIIVWKSIDSDDSKIISVFAEKWGIRERMLEIRRIQRIPRNSSGKVIYAELR